MNSSRSDFYFRNRRILLIVLAVAGVMVSRFRMPSVGDRLAGILALYSGLPQHSWMHAVVGLATALVGIGAALRTWGSAYLGTNVVQDRNLHTERLVADGPYRYTRNPLYLGNMFLVLGLALMVNLAGAAIFVLGMWGLVRLFIRDEEAGMKKTRGEAYQAYLKAVPRLIPSLRPRVAAAGAHPRWVQGICGEAFLWMLTVLGAGLAITLRQEWLNRYGYWGILVALMLYVWARWQTRKRAAVTQ